MGRLTLHGVARPLVVGLLALALLSAGRAPAAGQGRAGVVDRCRITSPAAATGACQEAALALEALLGGVGLAFSGASALPGSPTTLGYRLGHSPRWALSGRAGAVRFDRPDLTEPGGGDAFGADASSVFTLQGELALGAFEGFTLAPTVGGFLSLDLLGTVALARLSAADGFDGSVGAWGYGARLGLLRESFTLPALTLSVLRRHLGGFRQGPQIGPGVDVESGTVTSVRGSVGKEFLALGLLGGVGWDRAQGDGTLRAGTGADATSYRATRAEHWLVFGGLTRTWLVIQLSVEGGYARGYDVRSSDSRGLYDPGTGALFGSIAFRLIV